MLYTYNIRYKWRNYRVILPPPCQLAYLGQFCLKPRLMSAPGAQCFSAGTVMVLCGVVWSGLVWGDRDCSNQTVQQRKRRHGNGAGFRRDRYQIALSVHSDRKRHMRANICLIITRVCKLHFKRTNAKQREVNPCPSHTC